MLEDIDLICEILRILMEACTDNGKANNNNNDNGKANNNNNDNGKANSSHDDGGTKLNELAYQKD